MFTNLQNRNMKFRRPLPEQPLVPRRPSRHQPSWYQKPWSRTARKSFTTRPEEVERIDGLAETELLNSPGHFHQNHPGYQNQMAWRNNQHHSQHGEYPRHHSDWQDQHPQNPQYQQSSNIQQHSDYNKENAYQKDSRNNHRKDPDDLDYYLHGNRGNRYPASTSAVRHYSRSPGNYNDRDIQISPDRRRHSRSPPRRRNIGNTYSPHRAESRHFSRSPRNDSRRERRYHFDEKNTSSRSPRRHYSRTPPHENKRKLDRCSRSSSRDRAKSKKTGDLDSSLSPEYMSEKKRRRKSSSADVPDEAKQIRTENYSQNKHKHNHHKSPKAQKHALTKTDSPHSLSSGSSSEMSWRKNRVRFRKGKNPYKWVRSEAHISSGLSSVSSEDLLETSRRSEEAESDYNGDSNNNQSNGDKDGADQENSVLSSNAKSTASVSSMNKDELERKGGDMQNMRTETLNERVDGNCLEEASFVSQNDKKQNINFEKKKTNSKGENSEKTNEMGNACDKEVNKKNKGIDTDSNEVVRTFFERTKESKSPSATITEGKKKSESGIPVVDNNNAKRNDKSEPCPLERLRDTIMQAKEKNTDPGMDNAISKLLTSSILYGRQNQESVPKTVDICVAKSDHSKNSELKELENVQNSSNKKENRKNLSNNQIGKEINDKQYNKEHCKSKIGNTALVSKKTKETNDKAFTCEVDCKTKSDALGLGNKATVSVRDIPTTNIATEIFEKHISTKAVKKSAEDYRNLHKITNSKSENRSANSYEDEKKKNLKNEHSKRHIKGEIIPNKSKKDMQNDIVDTIKSDVSKSNNMQTEVKKHSKQDAISNLANEFDQSDQAVPLNDEAADTPGDPRDVVSTEKISSINERERILVKKPKIVTGRCDGIVHDMPKDNSASDSAKHKDKSVGLSKSASIVKGNLYRPSCGEYFPLGKSCEKNQTTVDPSHDDSGSKGQLFGKNKKRISHYVSDSKQSDKKTSSSPLKKRKELKSGRIVKHPFKSLSGRNLSKANSLKMARKDNATCITTEVSKEKNRSKIKGMEKSDKQDRKDAEIHKRTEAEVKQQTDTELKKQDQMKRNDQKEMLSNVMKEHSVDTEDKSIAEQTNKQNQNEKKQKEKKNVRKQNESDMSAQSKKDKGKYETIISEKVPDKINGKSQSAAIKVNKQDYKKDKMPGEKTIHVIKESSDPKDKHVSTSTGPTHSHKKKDQSSEIQMNKSEGRPKSNCSGNIFEKMEVETNEQNEDKGDKKFSTENLKKKTKIIHQSKSYTKVKSDSEKENKQLLEKALNKVKPNDDRLEAMHMPKTPEKHVDVNSGLNNDNNKSDINGDLKDLNNSALKSMESRSVVCDSVERKDCDEKDNGTVEVTADNETLKATVVDTNSKISVVRGIHTQLPACIPIYKKKLFKSMEKDTSILQSRRDRLGNSEMMSLNQKSESVNETPQRLSVSENAHEARRAVQIQKSDECNVKIPSSEQCKRDAGVDNTNRSGEKQLESSNELSVKSTNDLCPKMANTSNNEEPTFKKSDTEESQTSDAEKGSQPCENKPMCTDDDDYVNTNNYDEEDIEPIEMIGSVFTNERDLDAEEHEQNDFVERKLYENELPANMCNNDVIMKVKFCDDLLVIREVEQNDTKDISDAVEIVRNETKKLSDPEEVKRNHTNGVSDPDKVESNHTNNVSNPDKVESNHTNKVSNPDEVETNHTKDLSEPHEVKMNQTMEVSDTDEVQINNFLDNVHKNVHKTPRKKFAATLSGLGKMLTEQSESEVLPKQKGRQSKKKVEDAKVCEEISGVNEESDGDDELFSSGIELTPSKHTPDSKKWLQKAKSKPIRLPKPVKDQGDLKHMQQEENSDSSQSRTSLYVTDTTEERQMDVACSDPPSLSSSEEVVDKSENECRAVSNEKSEIVNIDSIKDNASSEESNTLKKKYDARKMAKSSSLLEENTEGNGTEKTVEISTFEQSSDNRNSFAAHYESNNDKQIVADDLQMESQSVSDISAEQENAFDISVFNKEIEVTHTKHLTNSYTVETTAYLHPKKLYKTSLNEGRNMGKCLQCPSCSMYFAPLAFTHHHDTRSMNELIDPVKSTQAEFRLVGRPSRAVATIFKHFVDYFHSEREQRCNSVPVRLPRTKTPTIEEKLKDIDNQSSPRVNTAQHEKEVGTTSNSESNMVQSQEAASINTVAEMPMESKNTPEMKVQQSVTTTLQEAGSHLVSKNVETNQRQAFVSEQLENDSRHETDPMAQAAQNNTSYVKCNRRRRRKTGPAHFSSNVGSVPMYNSLTVPLISGNQSPALPYYRSNSMDSWMNAPAPVQIGISPQIYNLGNVPLELQGRNETQMRTLQPAYHLGNGLSTINRGYQSVSSQSGAMHHAHQMVDTHSINYDRGITQHSQLRIAPAPYPVSNIQSINASDSLKTGTCSPGYQTNNPAITTQMVNSCPTTLPGNSTVVAASDRLLVANEYGIQVSSKMRSPATLAQTVNKTSGVRSSSPASQPLNTSPAQVLNQQPARQTTRGRPETAKPNGDVMQHASEHQIAGTSSSFTPAIYDGSTFENLRAEVDIEEYQRELIEKLCSLMKINTGDSGLDVLLLSDKLRIRGLCTLNKDILKLSQQKMKSPCQSGQPQNPLTDEERIHRIIDLKKTVSKPP